MTAQDPELSAALGWPGGISDPVLDRTRLLQMVAALCAASKQALEALKFCTPKPRPADDDYAEQGWKEHNAAITALRAALAQQDEPVQEPVLLQCVTCGTVYADGVPPQVPVQGPIGYLWPTGRHPEFRFTQQKRDGVDGVPLYTAPPQRKPLTEEEIYGMYSEPRSDAEMVEFARAIERAHGIKE